MTDRGERYSIDALKAELEAAGAVFRGRECRCVFHPDRRASAGIYIDGQGVARFKCHGCDAAGDVFDVRAKIRGVGLGDVLPKTDKPPARPVEQRTPPRMYESLEALCRHAGGRIAGTYHYSPDFVILRIVAPDGSKTFRQCHQENGVWLWTAPPKPWPLFNRENLGDTEAPTLYVEGEKDCETARGIGLVAVTNAGGAGKSAHTDLSPLAGRDICLWPDRDEVGKAHMREVAERLTKIGAAGIRIVDVDKLDLPPKGDLTDYLDRFADEAPEVKRRAILEILEGARPVNPCAGLTELIERTIDGTRQAIPLPWPRLSKLALPLLPATTSILVGAPGAGKSFLLLEAAYHLHRGGIRVSLFALEESRGDSLLRLLAQRAGDARLLNPEMGERKSRTRTGGAV